MKISSILGLNARTQLFTYKYNTRRGKRIADSKLQTAKMLKTAKIPHPKIYKKFKYPADVFRFNWGSLPDRFALKPSRGMGGEGIIVAKRRLKGNTGDASSGSPKKGAPSLLAGGKVLGLTSGRTRENPVWLTTNKEKVGADDLKLHTLDILEGAFSMGNVPDVAFVQEYVGRAKEFRRYAYRGTPDIRIIVFNKVPVMAMLRLPTKESGGRANLHQGAIGVGIDIATGITSKAIWHGEQIVNKPGTERKLRGIKIPDWNLILETAVRAQEASHLGYVGVDVVVHPDKGPQVLELNAQPGLQIQLANGEGLKKRLERVEDLDIQDEEHGVKIAKALFAGRFENRRAVTEGIKTIGTREAVKVIGFDGKKKREIWAKIDTGAWRTSIDQSLAKELGLLNKGNVLWKKKVKSSIGMETRPVINLKYTLAGRRIDTVAFVANRNNLRRQLIIGRRDLGGFLIKTGDFNK
jgi:alpha-L-glutamate ligase-like protein